MSFSNLSKRTKIIIGVVVGIIILWAIYYFGWAKPAAAAAAATKATAAGAAATAEALANATPAA